jgi:hypothetical protein
MPAHTVKISLPAPERTGNHPEPPRIRSRLWVLLHAQSLLRGPVAALTLPAEDDYGRLAARRDDLGPLY